MWEAAELRKYKLVKVLAKGGAGLVVRAKSEGGEGRDVAIKLIEDFGKHKYTVLKVLRELSALEYVTKLRAKDGLPPIFAALLDVFSPDPHPESGRIESLFVVMELKEKTLLQVLDKN